MKGRNLPGFMVVRQMTVTLCFFVIARVPTLIVEVELKRLVFLIGCQAYSWDLVWP